MCGRTACTLDPADICKACGYKGRDGKWQQPRWRDPPGGQQYKPSYNAPPSLHMPVLLSTKHVPTDPVETSSEDCEWVVQPMHWGLVPSWHKGDPKSVGFNMSNARSETVLEKKTYKTPLEQGRRCVVVAEGYYEWQTKEGQKQPYYIFFPDGSKLTPDGDIVKKEHEENIDTNPGPKDSCSDEEGWKGPRLLTMAGLFDVWHPNDGGEALYSFSIITVAAHKTLAWMHHRMPAILNGEDEIRKWLDFARVPLEKAVVDLIAPKDCVQYHPVSSQVNSTQNNSPDLVKPIDPKKPKVTASSKFMSAWLGKNKKSDTVKEETDNGPDIKRTKPS